MFPLIVKSEYDFLIFVIKYSDLWVIQIGLIALYTISSAFPKQYLLIAYIFNISCLSVVTF